MPRFRLGRQCREPRSSTQDLREGAELTLKQLGYLMRAAYVLTEGTIHTAEEETLSDCKGRRTRGSAVGTGTT